MKPLRLLLLATGLSAAAGSFAAESNPFVGLVTPLEPTAEMRALAEADPDAAFNAAKSLSGMDALMAAVAGKNTMEERMTAMRLVIVKLIRTGSAFLEKYPEDPRRWRVVQALDSASRELANEDGTPKELLEGVTWDPAVFVAWRRQIAALAEAAATAPDAPPLVKMRAEITREGGLRSLTAAAQKAIQAKEPVDFTAIKAEIQRLAAEYPTVESLGAQTNLYFALRTRAATDKETLVADARELAASPNPEVQQAARTTLEKLTAFDKPLEIAFTAVDGRQVDLKDYRGKVVLIDFWATWCGPCIAELPNIKKVYAAYHERGFEIIGITLENGRLSPEDTPDEAAAKLEKARQNLVNFANRMQMPWPQHFDGKFWKNEFAERFGIASIPAMLLLDQQGRLVTAEARGEKLEAEVKRLLGL